MATEPSPATPTGVVVEQPTTEVRAQLSQVEEFVCGWVGGLGRIPVGHLFDTVKVNMATARPGTYRSMWHCFQTLVARDGFFGLYKGVQSPALGMAALNGTLYFSNAVAQAGIRAGAGIGDDEALPLRLRVAAGMLAGGATSLVEGPVDLIKTQLQLRGKEYRSFVDAAVKIATANPATGLFQGLGPTLVRNVFGYVFFFEVYDAVSRAFRQSQGLAPSAELKVWQVLLAGGAAGTVFWALPYPSDLIKSVMQGDSRIKAQRAFPTMVAAASHIHATSGWAGFYRGFVPCVVRAGPANAAAWFCYEYTSRAFRWFHGEYDDEDEL